MKILHSMRPALSLAVLAFSLVAVSGMSHAQRSRPSIDDRVKFLSDTLVLSQVQSDSVRKIFEGAEKDRSALLEAHRGDRSGMHEAMGKIMSDVDARIEAMLTTEQKARYEILKKDRSRMMMGRPQSRQDRQDKKND